MSIPGNHPASASSQSSTTQIGIDTSYLISRGNQLKQQRVRFCQIFVLESFQAKKKRCDDCESLDSVESTTLNSQTTDAEDGSLLTRTKCTNRCFVHGIVCFGVKPLTLPFSTKFSRPETCTSTDTCVSTRGRVSLAASTVHFM